MSTEDNGGIMPPLERPRAAGGRAQVLIDAVTGTMGRVRNVTGPHQPLTSH